MPQVSIAPATTHELPALKNLLDAALGVQGGFLQSQADDIVERVLLRITQSEENVSAGLRPTYRLMVAYQGGEPIGFASMSALDNGLMGPPRTVLIDAIHVLASARKSGAGSALLRSAVDFADAAGAQDITLVVSSNREDNRFFARNGFGPVTSRRIASVEVLRRFWGLEAKLDPATGQLTDAERQRRRRILLKPRVGRRPSRTPTV